MNKRVAILGGGVAGLTAAQELIERGFAVDVFELKQILGGKARSMPVPDSATESTKPLPGEHGFRFFPGFYKHVPDTMRRIPLGNGKTVLDNLVATTRIQLARVGDIELVTPAHHPATPADLATSFRFFFTGYLEFPDEDRIHFAERLLVLLTSCKGRRFSQYEKTSWWEFIDADNRSEMFQKYFADGLTRSLVAAKAQEISTRTGGYILLQLMFDLLRPGGQADRVLNGPTNDVWIDPWVNYLKDRGVNFQTGVLVKGFDFADGKIAEVLIAQDGSDRKITADYYVCTLPVERMAALVTDEMKAADPALGRLDRMRVEWMNGIMFYLDTDVEVVHGHTLYIDSPWALTSISQKQFWPDYKLEEHGDGRVEGILSVDVSDWNQPGILHKRPARECSPEEIKEEVLAQLKAHLNDDEVKEIEEANIVTWFLDPAIEHSNPSQATNAEPLLINTAGSWDDRPEAVTMIPNLLLASDYVRTHTDLATMEAANEAARHAVNGILKHSRSSASRCKIWKPKEPRTFAPLRWYDHWRWRRGKDHDPRVAWFAGKIVLPIWRVFYTTARWFWQALIKLRIIRP